MYCYSCYAVMDVQPQTSMHQELSNLHRLDKFFTLQYPHNCEKPESYRPCHSLNPYRHRTLCTRGLLLLYIGQTTRDKCTVIPLMLLWMYNPKPPCTRNFQIYTDWQSFLLWGSLHSLEQPESSRGCHNLNPNRECLVWVFQQHVEGYTMLSMLGMA